MPANNHHTKPAVPAVRVHLLPTKHPVPPEPRTYRAPRTGNAPQFRSGNMADVYQDLVRYGAKSSAVSFRSFESRWYPQ
jgi:hypothetical protein